MTRCDGGHGQDGDEIGDPPIGRNKRRASEDDHADDEDEGEDEGEFEFFENLGDFLEEIRVFGFFGGCSPGDVDFEHMAEKGVGDVEGETTEENSEHEGPFEVFNYCMN